MSNYLSFPSYVEWKNVKTPTYTVTGTISGTCDWRLPLLDIKVFANKLFGYQLAALEGMPEPQPQDEHGQFLFEFGTPNANYASAILCEYAWINNWWKEPSKKKPQKQEPPKEDGGQFLFEFMR